MGPRFAPARTESVALFKNHFVDLVVALEQVRLRWPRVAASGPAGATAAPASTPTLRERVRGVLVALAAAKRGQAFLAALELLQIAVPGHRRPGFGDGHCHGVIGAGNLILPLPSIARVERGGHCLVRHRKCEIGLHHVRDGPVGPFVDFDQSLQQRSVFRILALLLKRARNSWCRHSENWGVT